MDQIIENFKEMSDFNVINTKDFCLSREGKLVSVTTEMTTKSGFEVSAYTEVSKNTVYANEEEAKIHCLIVNKLKLKEKLDALKEYFSYLYNNDYVIIKKEDYKEFKKLKRNVQVPSSENSAKLSENTLFDEDFNIISYEDIDEAKYILVDYDHYENLLDQYLNNNEKYYSKLRLYTRLS